MLIVRNNWFWFTAEQARKTLAKGREIKYAHELQNVVDRACERIGPEKSAAKYAEPQNGRTLVPS